MSSVALAAGHDVIGKRNDLQGVGNAFPCRIAALRPESSKALRFPYKRRRQMTFSCISCLLVRFVSRV